MKSQNNFDSAWHSDAPLPGYLPPSTRYPSRLVGHPANPEPARIHTGRELFDSNLLALTWIKGEAMPGELVDEILRGLRLERETDEQRRQRLSLRYRLMAR